MNTVDHYIDAARDRSGLTSDRHLARVMQVSAGTVNHWRTKKTWPSDEAMMQLAALAGADTSQALADLNYWRSKSPEARSAYEQLASRLKAVPAAIMIGILALSPIGTKPAQAAIGTSANIYYAPLARLIGWYLRTLRRAILR